MNKFYSILFGTAMLFALVVPAQAQEGEPVIVVQSGATINYYGTAPEEEPEPILGITTKSDLVINEYVYFNEIRDVTNGVGFRWNATNGELQLKATVAGSWGSITGSTPGDEGWLADGINNALFPATNAAGTFYPLILGISATSTPATADTELYVGGGGGAVFTGNVWITGSSTTEGGARFNDGSADVNFLVETNGDAVAFWVDGGLNAIGMGVVDPAAKLEILKTTAQLQLSYDSSNEAIFTVGSGGDLTIAPSGGDLNITGTSTPSLGLVVGTDMLVVNAVTDAVGINVADPDSGLEIEHTTAPLKLSYDSSNYAGYVVSSGGDLTVTASGGDISHGSANMLTTGNTGAANATFSGSLTVDTNTLIVNSGNNAVGIGTTTPSTAGASLAVYDEIETFDADSPWDRLVELTDSADDGIINVYENNTVTAVISGATGSDSYIDTNIFYLDGSADMIYLATSTASGYQDAVLTVMEGISIHDDASPYDRLFHLIDSGDDALMMMFENDSQTIQLAAAAATATYFGGDLIGIGTTTPSATYLLDIDGDVRIGEAGNADAFIINAGTGAITTNAQGAATADITFASDSVTDAFVLDASVNQIGIGTSTPGYLLDIDGDVRIGEIGNADAFVINAGTGAIKINEQGASTADVVIESDSVANAFVLDASVNGVGLASTTPAFGAQLAIGEGGTATSTVARGRYCEYAEQENGVGVYIILGANQAANQPFATTSVSCF